MPEEKFDWKRLVEKLTPMEPPYPPLPRFLFEGLEHHSVWVAGEEVDSSLEAMKERYKAEWRRKGYSESLIRMAEGLADDWVRSMAAAFAPGMPGVQRAIAKASYGKALTTADHWIAKIGEAAKGSKASV
ncbi:MAG: hypothetical protein ACE5Z5_15120 [Candidatus Bathyarchaeia archaeon]